VSGKAGGGKRKEEAAVRLPPAHLARELRVVSSLIRWCGGRHSIILTKRLQLVPTTNLVIYHIS
jgi:hypothetical protein